MNHLMENCYLNVGNVTIKQGIGNLIGIGHPPFSANHFLYSYEEEYMSSLTSSDKIKTRHFHSAKHIFHNLYTTNDGREFGRSILLYPKELEVKVEDQGDHTMFLNLDITIKDGSFCI